MKCAHAICEHDAILIMLILIGGGLIDGVKLDSFFRPAEDAARGVSIHFVMNK